MIYTWDLANPKYLFSHLKYEAQPVLATVFHFSAYKNCNVEIAMLAVDMVVVETFFSNTFLAIFAFLITNAGAAVANMSGWLHIFVFVYLLVKIIIWE